MDRIGRKQTMCLGFGVWTIMGFIIGGALNPIQSVLPLFIVLYGIFNAAGEMGPGVSKLSLHTASLLVDINTPRSLPSSGLLSLSRLLCVVTFWVSPRLLERQAQRSARKCSPPSRIPSMMPKKVSKPSSSLALPFLLWVDSLPGS